MLVVVLSSIAAGIGSFGQGGLGGAERDEERHGQGTMTYADGRVQVGQFEDGRYVRTAVEDRIYNACIMDKGEDQDMSVVVVRNAVQRTCRDISENPSWLDKLRYR